MATTDQYTIIGSLFPTRQALRVIGGATDCAVQVDAAAVAAKADAKGTITAMVMLPVLTTATGTILGFGDDDVVEYIQLHINAGLLTLTLADAATVDIIVQADAIEFKAHKWHHIAAVQDAVQPRLYVDGQLIDTTNDDESGITKWGTALAGLDKGFIGCANKAGDGSETEEFAGYISQVRYYDEAKTAAEIEAIYEYDALGKGDNDTTDIRNHWKFTVDLLDSGAGADNGTAVAGAIVVDAANEFTSKLTFGMGVPVTADNIKIAIDSGVGFAYLVQQA